MEGILDPAHLALLAALAPGLIGFGLSGVARLRAEAARRLSVASALLALGLAVAVLGLFAVRGPGAAALFWLDGPGALRVSVGAYVDGLTAVMLLTVTLIGAVVARYSTRYLDGDPRQARFSRWLSYTLSAVLVLIVSSNLAMLLLGWVATSHGLHQLLTHYPDRPAALLAARKKFLTSRLGDLMLVAAFVVTGLTFGSLEFVEILDGAGGLGEDDRKALGVVAGLLVLGAMTRSAQFPFHTWLPDSMEAPTPVSALMHAGIINAGGFLLIRMSPVLVSAPGALAALALGGAFTAAFGSIVMLTQTDVKRKYAYSTVSQMGFMMLQCGLGAFAPATLHMVGHAFYKGHAFLSAGSVVDPAAPRRPHPAGPGRAGPLSLVLAVVTGLAVVAGSAVAVGIDPATKPGAVVLGGVLSLAVAQLLLSARASARARLSALGAGVAIALVYYAGVGAFERLLSGAIPPALGADGPLAHVGLPIAGGALEVALSGVLVALFFLALLVQSCVAPPDRAGPLARAAWVHAHNGFYLGAIQNRVVQHLWPVSGRLRGAGGIER